MQSRSVLPILVAGILLACISTTSTQKETGSPIAPVSPASTHVQTQITDSYLSDVQQEQLLQLLFTNGGCDLPCFWGIVPGETSWEFAKAFLSTYNEIETGELWYEDNAFPAYSLPFQFVDSKGRAINMHVALTVENELVQRINVYAETESGSDLNSYLGYYSIALLFSQLGPPSQIFFDVYMNDLEKYPHYALLLLYDNHKMAVWLSGESKTGNTVCPQVKENGELTHLSISIANPAGDLDIYPPDWEFWSLRSDDDFLTTQEFLGITPEGFYQEVLNSETYCFTVK